MKTRPLGSTPRSLASARGFARRCLAELDGSCHTPIAAHAELVDGGQIVRLRALIALPDGTSLHRDESQGPAAEAAAIGRAAGRRLKAAAEPAFFQKVTA